jgi:hypothetical protein
VPEADRSIGRDEGRRCGEKRWRGRVGKVSSVSEQKRRTGSEVPVLGVRIYDSIEAWILNPSCAKSNRVILVSNPKESQKMGGTSATWTRRTALETHPAVEL